ncbi:hypothetical protein G6F57_019903 [Rhizopus arrhizus]|nr:hypothetical protein G6F57_019903 [Rhizopus arrhizus]
MQVCPALNHLPVASRVAALSSGKSRQTMAGDLPPSSSVTGTRCSAAAAITLRPTAVEPVNSRWSSGSEDTAAATSAPPCTTATRSGGNTLASRSARKALVRGVCSEGFSSTWLPAAMAVAKGTSASVTG